MYSNRVAQGDALTKSGLQKNHFSVPSDGGAYGKSGSCFIQRGAGDAKTKSETLFRHVGDGGMGEGKYKGEQARLGVGTKKIDCLTTTNLY